MPYEMDMSTEKPPQSLLKEGLRDMVVKAVRNQKSKAGNNMFVFTLQDVETRQEIEVYLVAEPGKRWMLKSLLTACRIVPDITDKFIWEDSDVLEKKITCEVVTVEEEWINRDGVTVKTPKSKINAFMVNDSDVWK